MKSDIYDHAMGFCMILARIGRDCRDNEAEMMRRALRACKRARLSRALFWALDESPGTIGYAIEVDGAEQEWHWVLRRLRNHPEHGEKLFAMLS